MPCRQQNYKEGGKKWDNIKNFEGFAEIYKNTLDDPDAQEYPRFKNLINIENFQYSTIEILTQDQAKVAALILKPYI